jgi:diguanylate cyclase (GGDEF)-like protein/PAS domain S-box-containing protein
MVLGHDCTTEANLYRALVASRELFKDLVVCSSDFAWETDGEGRFRFVSPKGALGFSAKDLNGKRAADLLVEQNDSEGSSPFEARRPQDDVEQLLVTATGGTARVRVSALPVLDDEGEWRGARGVCRDITESWQREQALTRAREREHLTRTLIDSIRTSLHPEEMLANAALAIGKALNASHATIYRIDPNGEEALAAEFVIDGHLPIAAPAAKWTATAPDAIVDHGTVNKHRILSAPCRYQDSTKGRLCIAWPARNELPPDVADIINGVSGQIGIVIAQAEIQEKLSHLSNTDELTGLPNRRAFHEQVQRSIGHHRRNGRIGTLLYIDLDNFKSVNDTHGHQQGDDALKAVAALLTDHPFRAGDIPGRLGGDEFAFWLEETDLTGAQHLAAQLHTHSERLKAYSGTSDKPLTLSIGIAAMDLEVPEGLEDMMARADGAMYAVKRARKGMIAIAEPPKPNKPA